MFSFLRKKRRKSHQVQNARRRCRLVVERLEERCLLSVDPILEWNAVMIQADAVDHSRAVPQEAGPVLAGRAFAIVSVAIYDALSSIEHIGTPYLTVAPNARGASVDAAVGEAAHDTLVALYSAQTVSFDAALARTLARVHDGARKTQGIEVGQFVAHMILAARANDGSATINTPPYQPTNAPGFHQADPTNPNQGFYAPHAGNITPLAVTSIDQFLPPPLDDGSIAGRAQFLQSPAYTLAYDEVLALGGNGTTTPTVRTPEQTEIGIFWGYDGRPGLGTPPRLYNQIVRVIAQQQNNPMDDNARLFALVNLAMADGGLTCWSRKYVDNFWRPILGIRNGNNDGNLATLGDPNWTPLGAQRSNPQPGEPAINFTPNFPSYTSGHATFGAAMFKILERFYGRDNITFTFVSDEFNGKTRGTDGQVRPILARTYHSFSQAAYENAESRIYLGIHWAFDRDQGIACGDNIANYVFDNFLRPRKEHHEGDDRQEDNQSGNHQRNNLKHSSAVSADVWAPLALGQSSGIVRDQHNSFVVLATPSTPALTHLRGEERRGENSAKASNLTLLAESRHPMPPHSANRSFGDGSEMLFWVPLVRSRVGGEITISLAT